MKGPEVPDRTLEVHTPGSDSGMVLLVLGAECLQDLARAGGRYGGRRFLVLQRYSRCLFRFQFLMDFGGIFTLQSVGYAGGFELLEDDDVLGITSGGSAVEAEEFCIDGHVNGLGCGLAFDCVSKGQLDCELCFSRFGDCPCVVW
jgi:hypothetical protein